MTIAAYPGFDGHTPEAARFAAWAAETQRDGPREDRSSLLIGTFSASRSAPGSARDRTMRHRAASETTRELTQSGPIG